MDASARRIMMNNDQQTQDTKQAAAQAAAELQQVEDRAQQADHPDVDGLKGKKPEELTPEELRLMADTMPGEGPGD
jgi:hypothetical protein